MKKQHVFNLAKACKAAVEHYPGVIFSKKAPINLNVVNYDTDFCYFYFSSGFEKRCSLKRSSLCTGTINAKRDFPDYKAYFDDDIKVMREYTDGNVLAFCEPWSPPGISSWVYTRKTALHRHATNGANESYMLGCFDLIDDVTLGIAKFKVIPNDIFNLHSDVDVVDDWFYDSFNALPVGMAIVEPISNKIILANKYWQKLYSNAVDIKSINDIFHNHITKLSSRQAAWITGDSGEGLPQNCDIGTYSIKKYQVEFSEFLQVVILRPSMKSVATPFWTTNLVNKR
jgi:hypothetical protein